MIRKISENELKELKDHGGKVTVTKRSAKPKAKTTPKPKQSENLAELKKMVSELEKQNQALRQLLEAVNKSSQDSGMPFYGVARVLSRNDKGRIEEVMFGPDSAGVKH